MTTDQAQKVAVLYIGLLEDLGHKPKERDHYDVIVCDEEKLCHAGWMCLEIIGWIDNQPMTKMMIKKIMRWIGFVQGTLDSFDLRCVSKMRRDNRSDKKP